MMHYYNEGPITLCILWYFLHREDTQLVLAKFVHTRAGQDSCGRTIKMYDVDSSSDEGSIDV